MYKGILKDEPKKKGIKIVQVAHLPSGRKLPLTNPPVNMFMSIPKEFKPVKQKLDLSQFVGKDKETGRYIYIYYIYICYIYIYIYIIILFFKNTFIYI